MGKIQNQKSHKKSNNRKLTLTAVFAAIAVVGSFINIPVFGAMASPTQHFVNVLAAVFLGPSWAVLAALIASLLRNFLSLGTLLAFPGSMCGAFLSGLLYKKTGRLPWAYFGEIFGTGIVGGLLSYPLASLVMGKDAALFTFVGPFLLSTVFGTLIAGIVVGAMDKNGFLARSQRKLHA